MRTDGARLWRQRMIIIGYAPTRRQSDYLGQALPKQSPRSLALDMPGKSRTAEHFGLAGGPAAIADDKINGSRLFYPNADDPNA